MFNFLNQIEIVFLLQAERQWYVAAILTIELYRTWAGVMVI